MLLSLNIPRPDPRLKSVDWKHVIPRLLLWAQFDWARRLVHFKGAPEPNDLVDEAVEALLQGRRTWPQGKNPLDLKDLLAVLIETMRSIASNYIRSQYTIPVSDNPGETPTPTLRRISLDHLPPSPVNPSEPSSRELFLREIRTVIGDDPLVLRMIELLDQDPDLKPRHLAEMLGVDVTDLYAARKRLRRKLRNFTG